MLLHFYQVFLANEFRNRVFDVGFADGTVIRGIPKARGSNVSSMSAFKMFVGNQRLTLRLSDVISATPA